MIETPETDEDRRSEQRMKALRRAKIVLSNKMSTFDCLVRSRADHGLKLEVESSLGIPDTFEIVYDGTSQRMPCEVVWRSSKALGVRLL